MTFFGHWPDLNFPDMIYLTKNRVSQINRLTIREHGGHFIEPTNLLNEQRLDFLLEAVGAEMFGEPLYPSVADKAAVYFFNLISGHVFQDGNKRTGLGTALRFLKINGFQLKTELISIEIHGNQVPQSGETRNEKLLQFTLEAASGLLTLDDCRR